jgi:hypothetical protein
MEQLQPKARLSGDAFARMLLAVVFCVELCWCIDYHVRRWDTASAPVDQPAAEMGEGLVINSNGLGYYAWLRSLIVDGDWSFDDEFDEHNPFGNYVPPDSYLTPIGRRANQWSIGPACLWAISVAPAHFCLREMQGRPVRWAPNGYSLPYQLLVGATSMSFAAIGLGYLYGSCRQYSGSLCAAMTAAWITLGTTVFYYNTIELSLAHGPGTVMMAGFVWYWITSYGDPRPSRWFLVGALLGLTALMRWQLVTYAVLPITEAFLDARRRIANHRSTPVWSLGRLAIAGGGATFAFGPQMLAWKCVYGSWLASPIQGVEWHWLTPSFWEILLGSDRSLFYWTPLTLIALAGAAAACAQWASTVRRERRGAPQRTSDGMSPCTEPLAILLCAFCVQLYALAAIWGKGPYLTHTAYFGGVFLGRSFGMRDMTESLVVLAPGLAIWLENARVLRYAIVSLLGSMLSIWNLLLVIAYSNGLLPSSAGCGVGTLLGSVRRLVVEDPTVLIFVALATIALAVIAWAARPVAQQGC